MAGLHSSPPALAASTIGVSGSASLTDAPFSVVVAPALVAVIVELSERCSVLAATDVVHGTLDGAPTVPAFGPALPAEFATNTPAFAAFSSAASCAPQDGATCRCPATC